MHGWEARCHTHAPWSGSSASAHYERTIDILALRYLLGEFAQVTACVLQSAEAFGWQRRTDGQDIDMRLFRGHGLVLEHISRE